ncbi:MAG: hypothetical protein AB3N63_17960 [Puniceicoccaceae bacterium]
MKLPSSVIKNQAECKRIAIQCGIGTDMAEIVKTLRKSSGRPRSASAVGTIGDRVYVLQYSSGYKSKRKNGWLAYGYDSVELFYLHLPQLVDQASTTGPGPTVIPIQGASCNN